jgi:hypothetical protein
MRKPRQVKGITRKIGDDRGASLGQRLIKAANEGVAIAREISREGDDRRRAADARQQLKIAHAREEEAAKRAARAGPQVSLLALPEA